MGRYYFGDIEGKFAFAIQSSDAADRFGVSGEQNTLSYYFGSDNLEDLEEELKNIVRNLGDKLSKVRKLSQGGVNFEKIKELKITDDDLSEFADFELGLKIRRQIKLTGSCHFEAEL